MIKIIYTDSKNQRLDTFLTVEIKELSRSLIQKMIKDELVLVNSEVKKSNYRLVDNDVITVVMPKVEDLEIKPINIDLEIVYEDKFLAVVNKPAGIVVYPGDGKEKLSLVAALMGMKMPLSSPKDNHVRNGIVHRLDKDTSGLVIIAKDNDTHDKLTDLFINQSVSRKYYALVSGVLEHDFGTIDAPVGRETQNRTIRTVIGTGNPAITYFKVIKRFERFTFIECELTTGRTHQIRVHMQYIKHPIINDLIYGNQDNYNLDKQMLQAYYIKFTHPQTNQEVEIKLDVREDFAKLMDEWS